MWCSSFENIGSTHKLYPYDTISWEKRVHVHFQYYTYQTPEAPREKLTEYKPQK